MAPERTPTMAEGEDVAGVMPEEDKISQEFLQAVACCFEDTSERYGKKSKKQILHEFSHVVHKLCEIQLFVENCQLKDIYLEMQNRFKMTGQRCLSVKEIQEAVSKLEPQK